MPSVPPARRTLIRLALLALSMLVLAAPADAATSCAYTNVQPVFSPWLDPAMYTPFPGSNFEHGASGWSWGGKANIVPGDSNVALAAGSHAVQIPGGGTAKSPWLCVNATTPSMRFFVRRVSGLGTLRVLGVLNGPSGKISSVIIPVTGGAAWGPSPVVLFPLAFMTVLTTTGYQAQFSFVADAGTTFRIDDIQLDPFKGH
jgi:hypothetical protein